MRADICDPSDEVGIERFKVTLQQLGATSFDQSWGIGVDVLELQIGQDVLTVFSDAWAIDIQGPENLVKRVMQILGERRHAK